jgi:CPA1 family monovalent cation:H+ antiporter
VLALFKSLKVHTRLSIIVEGESLFNDGIAAVLYTALLAALVVNRTAGAGEIGLGFGRAIVGGVLIGGGIGWGISIIMSHINDHLIEITLTTIAAYGASLMADTLGTSGVISVISSGIVLGYYRGEASMSATTRAAVYSFWEYIAFAINSLLFLLIGIDVTIPSMTRNITPMFIAIAVVLFARMAVVYLTGAMLSPTASAISLKWQNVLVWGGLRGALAIALALGLPRDLPGRDVVLAMTYGVVLWTILPQGLSMGWFLKKLGLAGAREVSDDYGRIVTQLLADRAALKEIENMGEEHTISRRIYAEITTDLRMEIASLEQQLEDMQEGMAEMTAEQRREAYRRLIAAQQNAMRHAWETGIASDDTISELIARLYERYNINEE